jgi:hypothetical protein
MTPGHYSLRFDRPIIIVGAPRSGSSFLFETLARSPDIWTVGGESHEVIEFFSRLHPAVRGYDSNRLTAADCDGQIAYAVQARFAAFLRDRQGRRPSYPAVVRFLEKTPKNALRVPFLNALFPDACFIYLYREPHENISSLLEAWKVPAFATYPGLPGWTGPPWCMVLIPEWRQLIGKSVPEIAAAQWASCNRWMLEDLAQLPAERWCAVSYADLVADTPRELTRLCRFAGIGWDQPLDGPLPLSRTTLTPPDPNKWRKHAAELERVLPLVEPVAALARQVLHREGERRA